MEHDTLTLRIIGDSILKGVLYEKATDRYVSIPGQRLLAWQEEHGIEVHNNAMFGCTVTKGLQVLSRCVDRGLDSDLVLLEFGGNDCDFPWSEVAARPEEPHESFTSLDLFCSSLRTMIHIVKAAGAAPLLMTLPPIDSRRYLTHICRNGLDERAILHWLGTMENISRRQELYSLQVVSIALETGVPLIDVRSGFLARRDCADLLCEDGIHPNLRGNDLIWSLIGARLRMRKSA